MLSVSEAIVRIGRILFLEHDLKEKLPRVMDEIIYQTQAEHAMIGVWSKTGEVLFETARNSRRENVALPQSEISTTIIAKARREKQSCLYIDPLNDPAFQSARSAQILFLRCVACAPLQDEQGNVFGFIYLDHRQNPAQFNPQTQSFLDQFALVAAGAILNALEHRRLQQEAEQKDLKLRRESARRLNLEERLAKSEGLEKIIARKSLAMLEALNDLDKVASKPSTVLIIGESGTGKELFAWAIKEKSKRRKETYLPINCASFPETLLASELFGYAKGAHSLAEKDKIGLLETAHGGTLFLDEIAKTNKEFQKMLLRFLDSGEFLPLGETKPRKADVRVIASTQADLQELLKDKEIYPDLVYRLQHYVIKVPPLRDRREDVPELLEHFLRKSIEENEANAVAFSPEARALLQQYSWPGNVRELKSAVNRAVIKAEGEIIQVEDLPAELQPLVNPATLGADDLSLKAATQKHEYEHLRQLLEKTGGDVDQAAALAQIHRTNFYKKMKRYGLDKSKPGPE